ncbi:class IV adenylate cyclase [Natronomonas salina]|uniref:class IV adenylate cyclase n=1 Tax=Natronomonas salina TaxID=1710540 RepID=UPI0015B6DEA1|nr:class IV adenylate cyclase [Natronomonas salina]QLD87556.1 class IV adenylate cyclase [Natronomonas salina]
MYEVEVKVRADHDAVRDRLPDLDAESLGTVEQADTYYGHPVRDFAETDEALRVRRETRDGESDAEARVTYKGPLVEEASKTREEFETGVGDGDTMAAILEELDFEAVETVEKTRERFRVGEYTVTLDTIDGLGEFVEVETESETVEPAREGAQAVLRDLGLDPDEQIRTSYLGLLLDG